MSEPSVLIGFELIVIFLFIMYAHLTVGGVKEAISVIEFGGVLAPAFWFWVVLVGLLLPIAVLIDGFMLRYIIIVAGQITFPIGF